MDHLPFQLLWDAALGAPAGPAPSRALVDAWPWWEQCLGWLLLQAGDYLQFWARSFTDVTSPVSEVPGGYAKFACNCSGISSWLSHSIQTLLCLSTAWHLLGSLSSPRHVELPEDLHMDLSLCQPLCP